jgi:hypothetical protein
LTFDHRPQAIVQQSPQDNAMSRVQSLLLSLALFVCLFAIYALSPVRTSFDSRWSIHTSLSLAEGKGGDLRDYLPLLESEKYYAIVTFGDRYYTLYPVGTSLLSLPIVALVAWLDRDFKRRITEGNPDRFEKLVASAYGALAALSFFWLIFQRFSSLPIAFTAAGVFGFCTSMWSTATRALWQHGPLVLMMVLAMILLLRARRQASIVQYAGIPLALAFIIRPTAAISIAVLSLYVLIHHREWFFRYAAFGVVVAIPWLAYNMHEFDLLLPAYYVPGWVAQSSTVGEAMLGHLVSPARGLFVYSPIFLLSLTGFAMAMRNHDERLISLCFGAVVVLHWVIVSRFPIWWGAIPTDRV